MGPRGASTSSGAAEQRLPKAHRAEACPPIDFTDIQPAGILERDVKDVQGDMISAAGTSNISNRLVSSTGIIDKPRFDATWIWLVAGLGLPRHWRLHLDEARRGHRPRMTPQVHTFLVDGAKPLFTEIESRIGQQTVPKSGIQR